MSKTQIKKIVEKYAEALQKEKFSFSALYVFGSQVKGHTKPWSDIDVAIVSNRLRGDRDEDRLVLWKARRDIDLRIEPHGFTVEEFKDRTDPLVYEVRKTGIRIK